MHTVLLGRGIIFRWEKYMSCGKVEINMHQKYVDIFYNTKKIGLKIKFENKYCVKNHWNFFNCANYLTIASQNHSFNTVIILANMINN